MTTPSSSKLFELVERFLDRTEVRLALAALIVLSVLPPHRPTLDEILLPIFAAEFLLRIVIVRRTTGFTRGEVALLTADAIALLTFLPIQGLVGSSVVRLLRLVRLIVLARFLRSVLIDLRRILSQRQIRYQLGFLFTTVLLLTLVGGTVLTTLGVAVDDFDNNGRPDQGTVGQVVWWTFRQIEDPGNLVEDAHGDLRLLSISLVLTIAGVFVMSFIIGIGTSVVGALMRAVRRRPVPLRDHTVVIGGGHKVHEVLEDLVEMYAKNRRRVRIAVLDQEEEPPKFLEEPAYRGVEYRTGEPTSLDAHELLATARAKRVIVLNNAELGEASDAYVISSILATRQWNPSCPVVAEMRHRRYLEVACVAGDQNINPIAMGKFLGCVMSQNLMYPGIDSVFEELLTARGSEIYTHIYSEDELVDLIEREGTLDFRALLLECAVEHRALPLGVFLGREGWTDDVSTLTLWLNPLEAPTAEAEALGGERGRIPWETLRGWVAIAPEYSTLRAAARQILSCAEAVEAPPEAEAAGLEAVLCEDMLDLRRVLVLGDNELLPAMIENTAEFVPAIDFTIVTPSPERRDQLVAELRRRGGEAREAEAGAEVFALARGGRASVISAMGDLLTDALEHPLLSPDRGLIDVVVLLADPQEIDPDATSTLTLLRLIELVGDREVVMSPRFRVVAEVLSGPKGELLERRLARDRSGVPVRIVPTRQLRSYFLVHSAYVPGLDRVHLELLTPQNRDFCQLRLVLGGEDDPSLTFQELVERLSVGPSPVIAFAVRLGPGHPTPGLVLNPDNGDSGVRFKLSEVEAVYAVGETERFVRSAS